MATIKIRTSEFIDRGVIKPLPTGSSYMNVGSTERIVSAAVGLALMYFGLRKFSIPGLLAGAVGAALFERGASGYCPVNNLAQRGPAKKPVESAEITKSLTINKPRAEVYQYWRKLENLPTFMQHLESVSQTDKKRSNWVAPIPGGVGKISWDAEIVEEVENEKLSWRSVLNAAVDNSGEVLFKDAPGDQGTEIYVIIKYLPPAGAIGSAAAKLFNPAFKQMVKEDLRRFKRLMETGEIPVSEAQPSGKKLAFGDTTHDKIERAYESPLL